MQERNICWTLSTQEYYILDFQSFASGLISSRAISEAYLLLPLYALLDFNSLWDWNLLLYRNVFWTKLDTLEGSP